MRAVSRSAGRAGFTIIELMVVVTIIAVIALLAIPNIISARMTANEAAAVETLRSISTAQAQFLRSGKADEDGDGTGEFGTFGEMTGAVGVRGGSLKAPTDLTASMRNVSVSGEVEKAGYIFRMYLPDPAGHGVRDNPGGGILLGVLDQNLAENIWCCYAWPARHGVSGRKSFFVNQMGDIRFAESSLYSGWNCAYIRAGNAFATPDQDSITGYPATGTVAADGLNWRIVN